MRVTSGVNAYKKNIKGLYYTPVKIYIYILYNKILLQHTDVRATSGVNTYKKNPLKLLLSTICITEDIYHSCPGTAEFPGHSKGTIVSLALLYDRNRLLTTEPISKLGVAAKDRTSLQGGFTEDEAKK